jgi:hypothetical protein
MEYRLVVGKLGAFYVEGIDPNDSACISPFNTKYSEQTPIMQFTGLLDKNGKDIYEGDILAGHDDGNVEVRWGQCEWWCSFSDGNGIGLDEMCIWFGNCCEVIGNIYQNGELLNV